jgi:glycosyltransferase involved in cell wall biosynthesis
MDFAAGFIGNLDFLGDEVARGWVVPQDENDHQAVVSLWIDNRIVAQSRASRFRPDLEQTGHRKGNCAFELKIPRIIKPDGEDSELRIEVSSGCGKANLYKGSLKRAENSLSDSMKNLISNNFERFLDCIEEHDLVTSYLPSNELEPISSKAVVSPVKKIYDHFEDAVGVYKPSKFVVYTRDRMNEVNRFDLEGNSDEADELLIWYLESYGLQRKPFRVPLSRSDIERSNKIITLPRCRFAISMMHYSYLLKHRKDLVMFDVLNDPDQYMSCIYHWVAETCIELNVEDVLIPASYHDLMNTVPANFQAEGFPLNNFLLFYVQNSAELFEFDTKNEAHRIAIYFIAIIKSTECPILASYVPGAVLQEVAFSINKDKDGLVQRIARKVLSDEMLNKLLNRNVVSDVGKLLSEKGYDLQNRRFSTLDTAGNRNHFCGVVNMVSQKYSSHCVIQLIGPLNKSSGLGQACRLSGQILEAAGYAVNYVDFDLDNPSPTGFNNVVQGGVAKKADINIIHLNAEALPLLAAYSPDILADTYNIGYFFWELDSPARCHSLAMDLVDEVWVSSEFGVAQYQPFCRIPVTNVGMSFEQMPEICRNSARDQLNRRYSIAEDATLYLSTFDSYSYIQRKNPRGIIAAFQNAFQNEESVHLIVKTQNKDLVSDPRQDELWHGIAAAIANDSRITFINETVDYASLMNMKQGVDCYVSLHRSEGWGFGIIESMAMGIPVVTTAYSGNMEFCTPENSWLVKGAKKYLASDDYIFVEPGQYWFDPDLDSATECLKEVYENPLARTAKSSCAKSFISDRYTTSEIAKRYRYRIDGILHTDVQQLCAEG